MSAAAKWKLKEKEAMASVAAKPDASGFKALKTDAPAAGGTAGAADILGRGGSQFASQKPIAASSAAGDRQQGHHSKLPLGKDSAKIPQTKEAKGSQVDYPGASFVSPGVSKISVGDKESSASNSGGRRSFGVGSSRTEEPTKTKEPDVKVSQAGDEADKDGDVTVLAAGRTKGLAGFWANQTDEVKSVKKKRLTAVEDALTPTVAENSPQPREGGVIRSEDPGEWKKPIRMQEGWTRNVVSSLQTQRNAVANRSPINLTANTSDNDVCFQDTGIKTAVKTKGSSQLLPQSEQQRPREKKALVDRSQDSIVLAENQPLEADPDVVRSESAAEEVVLEKGRTRNLLQHWKNTEVEYNATKTSRSRFEGTKPAWILEIEAAKGNINDDDYEDEITESQTEETRSANKIIATKDSERDKTRKRNGGDVIDQTAAGVVEPRGTDKKVPLKREGITAASGETKSASAHWKGQERFEQPMSVTPLKSDCRKVESDDNKFSHFRADEGPVAAQTTAKTKDARSVGEGAQSGTPSFEQNTRNKTPASSFENASRKEWKSETLTENELQYLPTSEKPATEEFRAWKATAEAGTTQNVQRSTDYEISYKPSAEEDTASSKISSTTQSEASGDHFGYLSDSSTTWTGPNAAQTDVFEAELLGQGEPKAEDRGSCVDSFASSVQLQPSSGVLEISTAIGLRDGEHPESAASSEFNPLSTNSPFVSPSGYNEKIEPCSSPNLDDPLRINSPSFPLDEGVDSTPCLLPTWSIAVENPVDNNQENYAHYAQTDSQQNEVSVYHKAVESSVDEAYDYRRADKIEATKKSKPSQRSCCVM